MILWIVVSIIYVVGAVFTTALLVTMLRNFNYNKYRSTETDWMDWVLGGVLSVLWPAVLLVAGIIALAHHMHHRLLEPVFDERRDER